MSNPITLAFPSDVQLPLEQIDAFVAAWAMANDCTVQRRQDRFGLFGYEFVPLHTAQHRNVTRLPGVPA